MTEDVRMMTIYSLSLLIILLCFLAGRHSVADRSTDDGICLNNNDPTCSPVHEERSTADRPASAYVVPSDCTLVMATSTIPNGGWGVFSLTERNRNTPLLAGDVVIQVPDVQEPAGMRLMLTDYLWNAEETGGFYEGTFVVSSQPGIGMLANGMSSGKHNVLPFVPWYDEGGLTRQDSPGAGACTHYHNYTFFVQKPIPAGGEVFVNYGPEWFKERQEKLVHDVDDTTKSVDWLRQHGRCLDSIKPGRSRIPHAGRGAFATRDLPEGSMVAPVPVLPVRRQSLNLLKERVSGTKVQTKQLLLNYCFGHAMSSLLLCPYSPMISLVNHGSPKKANVRVRWSTSRELHGTGQRWLEDTTMSVDRVLAQNRSGLLLEMVAVRDIFPGEELLLDYGDSWTSAWLDHLNGWKPDELADSYAPSYVQDDVIKALRTESELRDHPYPDNVFTSCFYRYSDNKEMAEKKNAAGESTVTTFRWNQTRAIFELRNLRPCSVLQRQNVKKKTKPKEGTLFTVRMRNRYGLPEKERIPQGAMHIVTHVPRHAIRFSDKIYTTDQHLENAFRHEIGLPDDIFPKHWKDLK